MIEVSLTLAVFIAALVAGVFLSFSDFVMRGLAQAPDARGADGMVGLNRTVYRSVFMVGLLGLVPVAALIAVVAIWRLSGAVQILCIAGALAYLVGVLLVTIVGNVPLNNRLDAMADRPKELSEYWPIYASRWTKLNHVRTMSAVLTAASWMAAAHLL